MEYINKVEIQGFIGCIKTMKVGDSLVAKMSVATNEILHSPQGDICQTTWHNVTAWKHDKIACDLEDLKKGDTIHVKGMLRNQKFIDIQGTERHFTEIKADTLTKIES